MLVFVIFLIAMTKYMTKITKERKVYFILEFEGTHPTEQERHNGGIGGGWSRSILCQEAEMGECWCSTPFLFLWNLGSQPKMVLPISPVKPSWTYLEVSFMVIPNPVELLTTINYNSILVGGLSLSGNIVNELIIERESISCRQVRL